MVEKALVVGVAAIIETAAPRMCLKALLPAEFR
jgi:hypothetical protein